MQKHKILNRWSWSVIFEADIPDELAGGMTLGAAVKAAIAANADLRSANLSSANLSSANLSYADLRYADLRSADLSYANLSYADLRSADLRYANLSYADLRSADLRYADISYANGLAAERTTPLLLLGDQPGLIRLYKLVNSRMESPIHSQKLTYEIGKTYEVSDPDTNPLNDCGAGIHVATLDWCLREWKEGYRILLVEFTAADIAAIPTHGQGKVRLRRGTVVGEKVIDPVALGLVAPAKKE